MTEWQPIETAPADTPLLVYYKYPAQGPNIGGDIAIAWFDCDEWVYDHNWDSLPSKPLYWMSLPEMPKE